MFDHKFYTQVDHVTSRSKLNAPLKNNSLCYLRNNTKILGVICSLFTIKDMRITMLPSLLVYISPNRGIFVLLNCYEHPNIAHKFFKTRFVK